MPDHDDVAAALDDARDHAAASEYYDAVARLRDDATAWLVVVTEHGGSIAESLLFKRFLVALRDDIDPYEHRRACRAWLATCCLKGDTARERDELRSFIRRACKAKEYMRP